MQASSAHIFGHRMFYDPSETGFDLSSMSGFRGWRLWREVRNIGEFGVIRRSVRRGDAVLDLGANIGLYTLLLARLVGPKGQVIAFEPGPKSFDLLTRNVAANGYANVRIENAAVLDRTGKTEFFICPTGESDNRAAGAIGEDSGWQKLSVPCFAMDDYLQGRPIDFVKMDIQGSELPALRGMRRTIDASPAIKIVMEYTPGLIDKSGFFEFVRERRLSIFDTDGSPIADEVLKALQSGHKNIVLQH